jgi:hypothetical protein
VQYVAPAYERWLELGKDLPKPESTRTLKEWSLLTANAQPAHQGRNLREWLESAAPVPSATSEFSEYAISRRNCEKAVQSIGTNAVPWLLSWMQSNSKDYILAKRGFGMLRTNSRVSIPAFAELAQTNDPVLRSRAYGCLSLLKLDWTNAWPALVPVLHNPDQSVRTEAAAYLYTTYQHEAEDSGLRPFVSPSLRNDASGAAE